MAYSYYSSIDAQNAAIGANETDFPVALVITDSRFATVANGGHVQNTDANGGASGNLTVPADFVVSPNSDGSSPYDFEIVDYDGATGYIELWVKIPSLSSSSDTTIYLVYGDAAVTTTQENVTGTWSDDFHAVYHCTERTVGIPLNVALDTEEGSTDENFVSSEYSGSYIAENAIDGNVGTAWASAGDGANSWIQINFDRTVLLDRLVLFDRSATDQWGAGQIEFSDTSTQAFSAPSATGTTYQISPAKSTTSIKLTITSGGAGNNRGFKEIQAWEQEGTAAVGMADSAGVANSEHLASGEPATVGGQVGDCLDFDGSNDHTQVGYMPSTPSLPFTFHMWVNPDGTTPVGIFDSAPTQLNCQRNYQAGQFEWQNKSPQFDLGLASGSWQHLVFVIDHDGTYRTVDWYKDGEWQAQESQLTASDAVAAFTYYRWGDINLGAAGRYAGLLDEFMISSVSRDAEWIATSYANQDDPAPGGAFWSVLSGEIGGDGAIAGVWPRMF